MDGENELGLIYTEISGLARHLIAVDGLAPHARHA